jgi:5-carboxymethyl-2-hydroxymuconic-semialdehyde dehydrogenase
LELAKTNNVGHFIDNKFFEVDEKNSVGVIDPRNNQLICLASNATKEEVDRAVRVANLAFKEWSTTPAHRRAEILFSVGKEIEKDLENLSRIESINTGIPISQCRGQIRRAAENFYFFGEMATKITGRVYPKEPDFINYTERMPVGVAALITPWNTPLMLETWKIAPCLAAGNTCILKPAEWTPLSANRLAELIAKTDLSEGVFNVVHGIGEQAGSYLVSSPGVKLVSFTGETETGKEIMRNGSSTLKRFSMELGGKNAAIVFEDANLEAALDSVIFMAFSLNGERCTSNSRVLVQSTIYEKFVDMLLERVKRIKVGDPLDENTELGPLVRKEHLERVLTYVEIGVKEGANLAYGGKKHEAFSSGNYMYPTLFKDATQEMRIAREEVFGPVLVVEKFEKEEEAIEKANDVTYGLTGYIWTNSIRRAHLVASKLEVGMVWINSHNVRDLRTPFGGMKNSGIGREGGEYSFDFYTELKTVHIALRNQRVQGFGVGG